MRHHKSTIIVASFLLISLTIRLLGRNRADDYSSEQVGEISFPTSCFPDVQEQFDRALALLYSFEYDKAARQFHEVQQRDPECAIAYWGEAMTLYHQLWSPPSDSDLAQGWQLAQKASSGVKKTAREEGYIEAISTYFKPGNQSSDERSAAYSQSIEKLHDHWPSDEEATVFYALSLLAIESPSDSSLVYAKNAASILNRVLVEYPDHPGALHYLIHACDNPRMAERGLSAAKRYASIAPSSPHAQHMPSHIFARLGMWQEDIASNLASLAAAEKDASGSEARLHAMDFLEYAYLQIGQDRKAQSIEEKALALKNEGFTRGMEMNYFYAQAYFPALLLLETRNWEAVESLRPTPSADHGLQVLTLWAQAVAAGHLRDVATARAAVSRLDAALGDTRDTQLESMAPPVDTNKNEAHAWLAFAEKDSATAFKLLEPVIQLQEKVGKNEVELPAREMYADMLLELGRPAEALEQYRLSLKTDPNRFNGLYGAGRSAELGHQTGLAATYYKRLLENCNQGKNSNRPELQHARNLITRIVSSAKH